MNDLQRVAAEGLCAVKQYVKDGTVPAGGQWAVDLAKGLKPYYVKADLAMVVSYGNLAGVEHAHIAQALEAKVANDKRRPMSCDQ